MAATNSLVGLAALAAALALGTWTAAGRSGQPTEPPGGGTAARADLKDAQGNPVGRVSLTQHPGGVLVHGELKGLPPGWHAIHVHQTGRCEPTFEAAAGHFAPQGTRHGFDEARGHAGDLPNIRVGEDGTAQFEMITDRLSLREAPEAVAGGAPGGAAPGTSGAAVRTAPGIFDRDGAAIVVHAEPDDYRSEPSGASGDRIACGVLTRE